MKDKALTATRWAIFVAYLVAYFFVWAIWGLGGMEFLEDRGITALAAFILASIMVMVVGFISFQRDLREFLQL